VRFGRRTTWLMVLTDLLLINMALIGAYWMRYRLRWFREVGFEANLSDYLLFAIVLSALLPVVFKLDGVYRGRRGQSWFDQLYAIVNATAKGTIVLLALTFGFSPLVYSRLLFLEAAVLIVVFTGASRLVRRVAEGRLRRRGIGVDRVLIVGGGEVGRTVIRTIVARPELGYQILGLVDDNPDKGYTDIGRVRGLGGLDRLPEIIETETVDQVIITLPWMYHRKIMGVVHECERKQIEARIVPDLFQMSLSQVDVNDLGGIPLIGVRKSTISRWQRVLKRAMDVVLATLMGIVLAPLLLVISLATKLDSPGPIVFRQLRLGQSGNRFWCYKFRSMYEGAEFEQERLRDQNEAEGAFFKMKDDPRRTRVGRWLRRTSLDELPQIYNVLRGEMSMVGPRPPLPVEVEQYEAWQMQRLEVPPGITGLWQVSGRSHLSFEEACLLDIYYIENWSPLLDIKILLRTIPQVFTGDGAY
jgi:exopolysaccharide biosynthesis polyprenyl glycosylphosphotransferase